MQFVDPALPRDVFGWHSPRLGMDMPIVRYGNWGHPLLLYPTAQSDLLDCERFFLIKSIEPLIFAGKVTVFSIESINAHAWMNRSVSVPEAAHRQALYSAYVEQEVVPHIRRAVQNDQARIGVTGASFGAFHAANQFFRRPDLFDTLIAMSGFYDLEPDYTHGFMNDDLYFNNPMSYVRNMNDEHHLNMIRNHTQIHIVTGQGDYEAPHASQRFSTMLWDKGIWNNLDMWGYDMKHDWPTWRAMLPYYLSEKVGW
jgi:esterase/lipase superfamily enzyme